MEDRQHNISSLINIMEEIMSWTRSSFSCHFSKVNVFGYSSKALVPHLAFKLWFALKYSLTLIFLISLSITVVKAATPSSQVEHEQSVVSTAKNLDDTKTIECLISSELAKSHHGPSMRLHGDLLLAGVFCNEDIVKAEYWYKKAYELSDKEAGVDLAKIYLSGENKQSLGIEILKKLADEGAQSALAELGYYFAEKGDINEAATYLERVSLNYDVDAIKLLGLWHLNEDFLDFKPSKALTLLRRASDAGDEQARFLVGRELIEHTTNTVEGIEQVRQSAESGIVEAITFLSNYYRDNASAESYREDALYWSIQAASNGEESSLRYLFDQSELKEGQLDFKTDNEFFDFLCNQMEDLGANSYLPAMQKLGYFYEFEVICATNLAKAEFWYRKAYEKGSKDSGFDLAFLLKRKGNLTEEKQYIQILTNLADSGHAWSAHDLGLIHIANGELTKAKHYFEVAAQKGEPSAYYNLGFLHRDKNSVFYDPNLALNAFKQGNELGHLNSKYHYGSLLLELGIDEEMGFRLIKAAARSGDFQAQFFLGDNYGNKYSAVYDLIEAKYWYLMTIINGATESRSFLANLYNMIDDTSDEFYVATTLLSESAHGGDVLSAAALLNVYLSFQNIQKAYYFAELALKLTEGSGQQRFDLLDNYYSLFIQISELSPLSTKIEKLLNDYVKLAKGNADSLYKAFYANYSYYREIGSESESKRYLSLAIQNAVDIEVKGELLNIFRNTDVDELKDELPIGQILELTKAVDELYDTDKPFDVASLMKSAKSATPSDLSEEITYLVALEGIAEYFLFYNDFKNSAEFAEIYIGYIHEHAQNLRNSRRNDKMTILSLLPIDFESAKQKIHEFGKYGKYKTLESNPQIEKLMIESKLYLAHGLNKQAKYLIQSAFSDFTTEIANVGVCFSDFALSQEEYFQFFSERELFFMAETFVSSLKAASSKYNISFLKKNCGNTVKQFGGLIHRILDDEKAKSLKKDWFNMLLSTTLYQEVGSQKSTLLNLATLNKLTNENERNRFKSYLELTRELDDKVGENLASNTRFENNKLETNKLNEVNRISQEIRELENEFHKKGLQNPLNPYNFDDFSVESIQRRIEDNEAVVIVSAFEGEMIGFYIDNVNFDIITTELSKSRYDYLAQKVLQSVTQDYAKSSLDLKPFAFDEAFELYTSFLFKFENLLTNRERVLVVNEGIEALSLSIIPTKKLNSKVNTSLDFGAYRDVGWFMDSKEVLYLPNINMLLAERADITLKDGELSAVGITPYWDNDANRFSLPELTQGLFRFVFQGANQVLDYNSLSPINEAIKHIEALTKSTSNTLLLGKHASKRKIISELENQNNDIVVFSTHALADSDWVSMPSLIIRDENGSDYSLLTTSDISKINLGAEWVFLLGCNTGRTCQSLEPHMC